MPFYFQAALAQSPLQSGISYMSLAVPQMIGLIAGGSITTATGHNVRLFLCTEALCRRPEYQMPVILVAQILCGVGATFLTSLRNYSSTALWATFMALTGLGIGLGVNIRHIAIQAVMKT